MTKFITKEKALDKKQAEILCGYSFKIDGAFSEDNGVIYKLKPFRHGYHVDMPYCRTLSAKEAERKDNVLEEYRTVTSSDVGCIVVNGINFSNGYGDGQNKVIVRLVKDVWKTAFSVENKDKKMLCSPSDLKINWYDCADTTFFLKSACFLLPHPKCILIKTADIETFQQLKKYCKIL